MQSNSHAINPPFVKFIMFSFETLSERYLEAVVCGALELYCIVQRSVSVIWPTLID